MTDTPTIPADLLRYDPECWEQPQDAARRYPTLVGRERWRQAQDRWCNLHGLDRAAFERLAMLQGV